MIGLVLSVEQITGAFAEGDRRHRKVRDLGALVAAFIGAGSLRARVEALRAVVRWVVEADRRLPLPLPAAGGPGALAAAEPPAERRRLEALVRVLEQPTVGSAVRTQLAALLAQSQGVGLFAETGLPNDRGLLHETTDRLFRRLLPAPRDDHDLSVLLLKLFPHQSDLRFLQEIPPELFARLTRAVAASASASETPAGPAVFASLLAAVSDAFVLISARVQGLGLSQPIRDRSRPLPLPQSPFFTLPRAGDRLLAHLYQPGPRGQAEADWRAAVAGCRQELEGVTAKLESTGISLDVVYAIEVIEQALRRLESLLWVLVANPGNDRASAVHQLLLRLVRARLSDRSLQALAYTNLRLLARKLVERAGKTGEHYITATRRQYWHMLASAGGGGILTLGTAALKVHIGMLYLPLFVEGLLSGVNYAASFLLIQLLGFTLATKQPSLTAATLAESIPAAGTGRERLADLVTHVARITRSQLCAAAGNVTTVSLTAVALDSVYRYRTGLAYLDPEKAEKVIASLHPLHSGTIWYAALTGVILWLSSLAGGAVENFAVYRRLPQAIAEHRLGRLVGQRPLGWLAGTFERNVSGWAVSIALGLMLGMTPSLGAFFGLPLDVRHVTLATGTLALALCERGPDALLAPATLAAAAGIAVIFVLNLGVSFTLALTVALRAKEIPRRDRLALATAILRRFLHRPLEFIFPPKAG